MDMILHSTIDSFTAVRLHIENYQHCDMTSHTALLSLPIGSPDMSSNPVTFSDRWIASTKGSKFLTGKVSGVPMRVVVLMVAAACLHLGALRKNETLNLCHLSMRHGSFNLYHCSLLAAQQNHTRYISKYSFAIGVQTGHDEV